MYEKDDRIITHRDVYSVRYDRQASPSLPFPNTSLPLPAPLACISSTHSPRRFVLCVFRPLRSFALAVRFASSCSRERERQRWREGGKEKETNGTERKEGERPLTSDPSSLVRISFSLSHSLSPFFSSASYSRYAFRHTPRVATILLPSFVSSFPSRFSPRSLLRFVIFVTVSACPNGKQRATLPVGRYFSSP